MYEFDNSSLSEISYIVIGIVIAFCFRWHLQKLLLKSQNKDKVIDLLMELLDKQVEFYVNHWSKDGDNESLLTHIDLQTRFGGALHIASKKYNISKTISIQYKEFYKLTSGDDFGTFKRKADENRCKKIHVLANDVRIKLLECKI